MGCNSSQDKYLLQEIDRLNNELKVTRLRYKYLSKHYGTCRSELKRIQQRESFKRNNCQVDQENTMLRLNHSKSTLHKESSVDHSELIIAHQAKRDHYSQLLVNKDRLIHR